MKTYEWNLANGSKVTFTGEGERLAGSKFIADELIESMYESWMNEDDRKEFRKACLERIANDKDLTGMLTMTWGDILKGEAHED